MEHQDRTADETNVYCLFCATGSEEILSSYLRRQSVSPLIAFCERTVYGKGEQTVERRRILPGYVFFETQKPDSVDLQRIRALPHVLRLLEYDNGDYTLRNADLSFYQWLKAHDGVINRSRAYKAGDRIRIVDGFLKEYEGNIIKINTNRKCALIQLYENSIMGKIWCSIELIAPPGKTDSRIVQHGRTLTQSDHIRYIHTQIRRQAEPIRNHRHFFYTAARPNRKVPT